MGVWRARIFLVLHHLRFHGLTPGSRDRYGGFRLSLHTETAKTEWPVGSRKGTWEGTALPRVNVIVNWYDTSATALFPASTNAIAYADT